MAPANQNRTDVEALVDEFAGRLRKGETPSITDYVNQHPELAEQIRELFPPVVMMEQLKRQKIDEQKLPVASLDLSAAANDGDPKKAKTRKLGDFRIIREIGRGGMGIVYEAEQISLRRRVALKILPSHITSERRLKRFRREAKAAARLHHTNIVPVFGVGRHKGIHYYVMQYIHGQCLDQVLDALAVGDEGSTPTKRKSSSLPEAEAFRMAESLRASVFGVDSEQPPICMPAESVSESDTTDTESITIVDTPVAILTQISDLRAGNRDPYWTNVGSIGLQVSRAVGYAHEQGVLHRDIKPANLIMDWQGRVWVTDFGLAKAIENDDITMPGDVVGTIRYMAPERFSGTCDERSEVYSVGLALYELATLRPAFDQGDRGSLIQAIADSSPPRPSSIRPSIPRDLETIIVKAIAREPSQRYETATHLADDLQRFLDDRPILARRISPWERLWRWTRRNPVTAASLAMVVLLLLTVASIASTGYYIRTKSLRKIRVQKEELERKSVMLIQQSNELQQANQEAAAARDAARRNLDSALEAFHEILQRIAKPHPDAIDGEEWESVALQTNVTEKDAILLESLLRFYKELADQNDADLQTEIARAHRLVGDVHQQIGQFDDAIPAYREAFRAYLELAKSDPRFRLEAVAAKNQLGITQRRRGVLPSALREHRSALELLTNSSPEIRDRADAKYELAQTHLHLSRSMGRSRQAGEHAKQSREILETLVAAEPDKAQYHLALARAYRDRLVFRTLFSKQGRPTAEMVRSAHKSIQQSARQLELLVERHPDNPRYKYELAQTYALPYLRPMFRNDRRSVKELNHATSMVQELCDEYKEVPEYTATLARMKLAMARIKWEDKLSQDAEKLHTEAMSLHASLLNHPGARGYYFQLVGDVRMFAKSLYDEQHYAEARQILESTISKLKSSIRQLPRGPRMRDTQRGYLRFQLLPCYALLEDIYRAQDEPALARRVASEAKRIKSSMPAHRDSRGSRDSLD